MAGELEVTLTFTFPDGISQAQAEIMATTIAELQMLGVGDTWILTPVWSEQQAYAMGVETAKALVELITKKKVNSHEHHSPSPLHH